MPDTTVRSKVRFGICNARYAVMKADGTYEDPVAMPGAESVDVSTSGGNNSSIYADNEPFYNSSSSGSVEISVQMARFPRSFLTDVCGQTEEADGAISQSPEDTGKEFAFMFELSGDQGGYRVCYFRCTATVPVSSASTNTDSVSEAPETSTFTAVGAKMPDGKTRTCTRCETGDDAYADFLTKVPFATAASAGSE